MAKISSRQAQTKKTVPEKKTQTKLLAKPGSLKHTEPVLTGSQAKPRTSKASLCLQLLRQTGGATLQDLMAATGWQAHSVRGFLSGTVRKKMGLKLNAIAGDDSVRRYHLAAEEI